MSPSLEELLNQAEEALEVGQCEQALGLAEQALALGPLDADALELKGLALAELGEFEAADETFAILLKKEPRNVGALIAAADVKIREPLADLARIEAGLMLLSQAEPLAQKQEALLIEIDLLRGIGLNHLGQFEQALTAFARVLKLEPDHGEAQLENALGLFELGRFSEAQRRFEQLAAEYPQEPWSFHYLGLLAERRGQDAEHWFRQARALDPDEFPLPPHLSASEFDAALAQAIEQLPAHAQPHLQNVLIKVEAIPTDADIAEGLSPTVLGVFQGTPIDERLDTQVEHHQTAQITLFQKNLERFTHSQGELLEEIRITLLHEVGHLLGLDEEELGERGLD